MKRRSPDSTNLTGLRARRRDLRPRLALFLLLLAGLTGAAEPQEPAAVLLDDPRWSLAFGATLAESELPGRPSFGPAPPADPVAEADRWQALATLAADLESAYEREPTAVTAHALGLFRLLARQPEDALPLLEEAVAKGFGPAAENDLAVARLLRFEQQGRPEDVARAIERADRAGASLEAQESPPGALAFAACFTRATALERFHLSHAAQAEIERCAGLAVEPEDQRRVEERRQALDQRRQAPSPWEAARQAIEEAALAGDDERVERLVSEFLPHACAWGIDALLPAWAEARRVGDLVAATDELTVARSVGRVLAELGSDTLLAGAVGEIDAADAGGLAGWEAALSQVHQADLALADERRSEAIQHLTSARDGLEAVNSPLALWAQVGIARQHLAAQHYAAAADFAWPVRRRLEPRSSRLLWSQVERQLAVIDAQSGDPAASLGRLLELGDLLDTGAPSERAPGFDLLLAELSAQTGREEEGWRLRFGVLEATDREPALGFRSYVIYTTVAALHRMKLPRTATWAAEDLVLALRDPRRAVREETSEAEIEIEALRLRGRSRVLAGDSGRGWPDFTAAQGLLGEIDNPLTRQRFAADLDADESRLAVGVDPERAVRAATAALVDYRAIGDHFHSPELYLLRAQAREELEQVERAAADYRRAVELREEVRSRLADPGFRRRYFDSVQAAFDAAIRFEALVRGDEQQALELSEQARARTLLDLARGGEPEPLSIVELTDRMPPGVTLLSYVRLDERLLVWRLRRDGAKMVEEDLSEIDLDDEIQKLLTLVQSGATTAAVRPLAAELGRLLLGRFTEELAAGEVLVVVPDGSLFELPFPLLIDPHTERFLIQDRAVGMASSVALYLAQSERLAAFPSSQKRSLLAVGDPAFDQARHPDVSRLLGAKREVDEIAQLYERQYKLPGSEATPDRFLELLPSYQVVHVAAHVRQRPDLPELSALLLASTEADEAGGELRASSILERDLSGVEIVVLSACSSVERFPRGREGVAGAARPFLEAGVPVVVASLWPIDDQATVALMTAFHRRLANGTDAAEALRQAQLELLEAEDPAAPNVWAAFEIVGGLVPR